MLERCVKNPLTLHRLHTGPAGPCLDGFAESMGAAGYSSETIGSYLHAADHLGQWAVQRRVAIADLDEDLLARFVRHLPRCRCRGGKRRGHRGVPFRVQAFLRYLREVGVVTTSVPEATRPPLVTEYSVWMRDRRGLAATTMAHSVPVVQALLATVGDDPTGLAAAGVRRFVLEYIQQHAPASAGCVTTIVRCFLRWLVVHGRCSPDLVAAVPTMPTWRLATLPRALADADVERIIEACDRPSPVARRDRAMLLLLARLGLRAGDVVALRLGDIEWERGRLRVVGKGRRETRLPLPQDAGDAMLGYLEAERPAAATDHVFLTARPPIHPLRSSGLRDVVCRAIGRAGVQAPSRGTHILRHSLATRLLRDGATLDAIGAVLRHRDVNTTALYAKVDVGRLRQVAQPWPDAEPASC
ncbi:MAG: tyrosine-type recombinase/integrase [Candidatus Rokubacteria bacterium]|nr:tyrosine-type recombinase/integrase [Candidatus Rokubacteria bacterium]